MKRSISGNPSIAPGALAGLLAVLVAVLGSGCGSVAVKKGDSAGDPIVAAPTQVAHTSEGAVGYRSVGSGPGLLLITGYAADMDDWPPAVVNALARSHRVITIDNAGVGETSELRQPLSVDKMAAQVDAFLRTLHLGPIAVLGWSMGGFIAQALAVDHSRDVARLVLCATAPGNGKATLPTAAARAALARPNNLTGIEDMLFPGNQQGKEVPAFAAQIAEYPDSYRPPLSADVAQSSASSAWLAGRDPAGRQLARIMAPTLIDDGEDDIALPARNDELLHSEIPGSHLVLYPDAGHGFFFQDRATWVSQVDSFLGSSPRQAGS
ncbi:MAG: alpha/beta hydrolase [Candidatus Dormiibacterota bacterium]